MPLKAPSKDADNQNKYIMRRNTACHALSAKHPLASKLDTLALETTGGTEEENNY